MNLNRCSKGIAIAVLLTALRAVAQGTLEDYHRAQRFLPGNLRHEIYVKDFDLLFVPNMFHGESGEPALYLVRRRWDYFVQHLLGVRPPANFEIKEDREPGGNGGRRRR
jgi:hypothetical protein